MNQTIKFKNLHIYFYKISSFIQLVSKQTKQLGYNQPWKQKPLPW
jgi:hypothetical protein